jgi:hypothetical protein
MQTVRGYAGRSVSEKLVAPGTAISANNVNFGLRTSYQCGQLMEQVEKTWVKSINRPSSMITEKSIKTIDRIGEVSVAPTVDQINLLVGVGMVEPEPVFPLRARDSCFPNGQAENADEQD